MFSVAIVNKATLSYFVLLLLVFLSYVVFVNRGFLMLLFIYVLTIAVFVILSFGGV